MPNVDPPWDKLQETQHCPLCEEAARKLADCQAQLAVARELLGRFIVADLTLNGKVYITLRECRKQAQAFLTSAPADLVVVKREDLDWLWKRAHTAILTNNKLTPHCESYNRIKKALEDSK